uniref:Matrix-remodeling-associated protein 7 helical domain-containing protein n=1 Tax=Lutzomyia longipalpis TaxID=7200 RepID=A0A1B0CWD8_LUTLO
MVYLEEISAFVASASVLTVIKIVITVSFTIILRKRLRSLRPPEAVDRATSKGDADAPHDETEDESCGQELWLMGQLKSAKLREMEKRMSEEQKTKENEVQQQQLAAIFELLKKQQEELKAEELTQEDFKDQLKLYR